VAIRAAIIAFGLPAAIYLGKEARAATVDPISSGPLPPLIELRAGPGEEAFLRKPLPCPDGQIDSTLEIVRSVGSGGSLPVVAIGVEADNSRAFAADIRDDFLYSHFALTNEVKMTAYHGVPFSNRQFRYDQRTAVSVTWNSDGLVTATVGGMETHHKRLLSPPGQISFGVASAEGRFRNSKVTCFPDAGDSAR
jgi:hypothetical protein